MPCSTRSLLLLSRSHPSPSRASLFLSVFLSIYLYIYSSSYLSLSSFLLPLSFSLSFSLSIRPYHSQRSSRAPRRRRSSHRCFARALSADGDAKRALSRSRRMCAWRNRILNRDVKNSRRGSRRRVFQSRFRARSRSKPLVSTTSAKFKVYFFGHLPTCTRALGKGLGNRTGTVVARFAARMIIRARSRGRRAN